MQNWCDVLGWNQAHLQEMRFMGYTYLKEGKYEEAKILFEALTILEPEEAYNFRTLGVIYLFLGDNSRALQALEKALMLQPDHLGARINRAKAFLFLGKTAEGLQIANELTNCAEPAIAQDAEALLMAYQTT